MSTHGALTESSLSYRVVTHDRKGREGKGREGKEEVGHPSIRLTDRAGANLRHLQPDPSRRMDDAALTIGGGL